MIERSMKSKSRCLGESVSYRVYLDHLSRLDIRVANNPIGCSCISVRHIPRLSLLRFRPLPRAEGRRSQDQRVAGCVSRVAGCSPCLLPMKWDLIVVVGPALLPALARRRQGWLAWPGFSGVLEEKFILRSISRHVRRCLAHGFVIIAL